MSVGRGLTGQQGQPVIVILLRGTWKLVRHWEIEHQG